MGDHAVVCPTSQLGSPLGSPSNIGEFMKPKNGRKVVTAVRLELTAY